MQRPAFGLGLGFPQAEISGNLVASGKGSKEATIMPHHWPSDRPLVRWELDVLDRGCHVCGRKMHVCDHRRHPIYTLQGPRLLVNRLVHCVDPDCAGHHCTVSPEAEAAIALPRSIIGWDLFCWIGHRRFARHWSVPQIRAELLDSRQIGLSDDAIEDAVRHYQRHAVRASRGSPRAGGRIRRGEGVAAEHRRATAGKRSRDVVRGAGIDVETSLVRRGVGFQFGE